MRLMRTFSKALLCCFVLTTAALAAEPDRVSIIDEAIAFHGGDLYRHSSTELDLCSKSGCFRVRAAVDGDRFDHTVSGKSRGAEVEVRITNDTVEAKQDGRSIEVGAADEQRRRDFVMARVYFPFLPYRLTDPGVFHEDLGIVDWDGRRLHKVKVTFQPGSSTDADDEYMYWFDPDTGRVEYFAYSYSNNGGGIRFRRAIDHRRVGGILFFDQENLGAEGGDLRVDDIDAAFVETLRHVSTVRLQNIRVDAQRP